MTPLRLTLEGLYSYQESQTIDFTTLTGAHLFGIFGATGSGKSSILEAISFALYGQSERLNQRDNRGYNMMNLKSNQLFIHFEFESEGKHYLFTVNGKRNSKRFDSVGTLERKAFLVEGETITPLEITTAEPILGLSYDNFKRTIIIPQGRFQEFLQLTDTERTRMLKEIFSLNKYELYQKTVSLERKNETEIRQKETLILQLAAVTPEAVQHIIQQIQELELDLTQRTQTLRQQEKQLQKLNEVRQLFEKIDSHRTLVQELQEQSLRFQEREHNLREYEACLIDFKPLLDQKKDLSIVLDHTNQTVFSKKEAQTQSLKELTIAEENFRKINETYQHREQFIQRADELEEIIQLKEMDNNLSALISRIQNGKAAVEKKQLEIDGLRTNLRTHSSQIKEIRAQTPDLNHLLAIRDWFLHQKTFILHQEQAEKLLAETATRHGELKRHKTDMLKSSTLDPSQYGLSVSKLNSLLQGETERLENLRLETEKKREQLLTQSQLNIFARKLEEGTPCPLCGATHHPDIIEVDQVDYHLNKLGDQIQTVRQQILEQKQLIVRMESLDLQLTRSEQEHAERTRQLQDATHEFDKHKAGFVWKDFSQENAEAINVQIADISRKNQQIQALNQEKEALEIRIETEERNRGKFQKALEGINKQQQHLEIQFQAQKRSLKLVNFEAAKLRDNLQLEQEAVDQREKHKNIINLYQEYEKRIQQLRTNVDVLKGEISELEKQEHETTQRIAQLNQQLNKRLAETSFTSIAIVAQILDLNLNIETEKNAINRFRQQFHSANSTLKDLEAEAKDKTFNPTRFQHITSQIESLNQEITEKNILVGGLKNELGRLEKDLKQKNIHQQAIEGLHLRAEDIKTLKNMFARSGFVNYVSTIYLQNLCMAANERFSKLTRGAYSLEPTQGNNFQVRDYLNNGQVRSVKTLSGGQTFQAALSLALSLADHVQQQARANQNFFFLDEGFGSQDKKSLQVIFETLKSLRKENRIVGVISHVEELQQEIDAYLFIENDDETGSKITTSWEL